MYEQPKKYLLFAGNPGVGKSTLLNCIMNERISGELWEDQMFKSGISYGSGMTFQLDTRVIGDTTFMDTPGLEDTKKRKEAAEAITEALKKDGDYQIVFVVTLESGRVRPADITTITLVLESAKEITHYGVIFNKLGKKVLQNMSQDNKMELLTQVSLESGSNKPVPIPLFLGSYSELHDEDNALTIIPELGDFLMTLLPIKVTSSKVEDISTDNYETLKFKMEEELTFLKENNKEMQRKMKENEEYFEVKLQRILEEERARHEHERRELKDNHERLLKQIEKQLQQTKEDAAKMEERERRQHEERLQQMEQQERILKATIERMDNSHKESLAAIKAQKNRPCTVM